VHQTRKAVSDARHAAEAARAAAGKKAGRISRRTKKMHGTLGDHHDAVVARDTAPDIRVRARLAGEDAFSFGVLCAQSDRRRSGL
jgi:CHAD domain-containing protein